MPVQTSYVDIRASSATVFRFITEPECLMRWVGDLKSTRRESSGALREGTRSVDEVESFGHTMDVRTEVVRLEPGRSVELSLSSRAFDGTANYLIEPSESGVRLSVRGDVRFKGIYKMTGPMMAPAMQKKLEQDLARLKALAETEDSGESGPGD